MTTYQQLIELFFKRIEKDEDFFHYYDLTIMSTKRFPAQPMKDIMNSLKSGRLTTVIKKMI